MNLEGMLVVVIGGTSGIGLATAHAAGALGAEVAVIGRDEAKLDQAARDLGSRAIARRVDARDRQQLDVFFAELGRIDHLVLSAGGAAGAGPIGDVDLAELREGFESKLFPHLAALQAALPYFRPTGSVTFVSAASAGSTVPGAAGLAAINGALEAMIPTLAVELKPIRVNAISPGVVDTPWWQGLSESDRKALFAQYAAASPAGRVGTAEDIAAAMVAVIANSFITGTIQRVDGGLLLAAA